MNRFELLGKVTVRVLEAGRVVKELPQQRNLILDTGLDYIGQGVTWAGAFQQATVGSGTTVTRNDSGAITAACSASSGSVTVTASSGFFTAIYAAGAADACGSTLVGRLIRWDTGRTARITSYVSDTRVVATLDSQTALSATGEFTVYRVNQTALESAVSLGGSAWCDTYGASGLGTTYPATGVYEFTLVFEFPTVTGTAIVVREFGVAPTTATPLFARILLDSPVTVDVGQSVQVTYALTVTLTPTTPVAQSAVITGIGTVSGSAAVHCGGITRLNVAGAEAVSAAMRALDPCRVADVYMVLLESDATLPSGFADTTLTEVYPSGTSGATGIRQGVSLSSYVAGSFYIEKSATWGASDAVYTLWNYLVLGADEGAIFGGDSVGAAWSFQFTDPFEKSSGSQLTLRIRISWDRAW